jgi:hypothetical protein
MVTRRQLRFDSLDDIVRDAEHLNAVGYDAAGKWDLAQVCGHLTEWLRFPMDGFPRAPLPIRALFAVLRPVIGRKELLRAIAKNEMRSSATDPGTVPPPGGDPAAAVAKLKETVERAKAYAGEIRPSPFFGQMTRDEWFGLNRVHAAHHLSFLVPRTEPSR